MTAVSLNGNFASQALQQKHCNYCNKILEKIMRCAKCKKAFYCNRDCQSYDWSKHKTRCISFEDKKMSKFAISLFAKLDKLRILSLGITLPEKTLLSQEQIQDQKTLEEIRDRDKILDLGSTQNYVIKLGQKMFDKYKNLNHGDSRIAIKMLSQILDSMYDRVRARFVEAVWYGIGDHEVRWIRLKI